MFWFRSTVSGSFAGDPCKVPETESTLWHGPWFLQRMCRIYGGWGLGFEAEGLGFSVATVQGVKLEGLEVEGFRVWGVSV